MDFYTADLYLILLSDQNDHVCKYRLQLEVSFESSDSMFYLT